MGRRIGAASCVGSERSYWTLSKRHAEWFAAWERRALPGIGPSTVYRIDIDLERDDVADLRHLGPIDPSDVLGDALLARLDALGISWVIVHQGPIEGEIWQVVIRLVCHDGVTALGDDGAAVL